MQAEQEEEQDLYNQATPVMDEMEKNQIGDSIGLGPLELLEGD